jgi:hypothetical protein
MIIAPMRFSASDAARLRTVSVLAAVNTALPFFCKMWETDIT